MHFYSETNARSLSSSPHARTQAESEKQATMSKGNMQISKVDEGDKPILAFHFQKYCLNIPA